MPVYNKAAYLDRCINSILNQEGNFKLRVILVDDGSTDNSIAVIHKYTSRFKNCQLILSNHQGVSAARNIGLKNAYGDFVIFVDADDSINSGYISKLITLYIKYNVDLVISGLVEKKENGLINTVFKLQDKKISLKKEDCIAIFNDNSLFQIVYTRLFNLEIIKKHNIHFEHSQFGEDSLFMMEYLRFIDQIFVSSYIGYNNYLIKNTLSRKKINKVWENTIQMADRANEYFNDNYGLAWHYLYLRSIKLTLLNSNEEYSDFKKECQRIVADNRFAFSRPKYLLQLKDKFFLICLKLRLFKLLFYKYRILSKN